MRKSRMSGSARGRPSNGLVYSPHEIFINVLIHIDKIDVCDSIENTIWGLYYKSPIIFTEGYVNTI